MIASHPHPAIMKAAFWKTVGWAALALIVASIAVLWSWNTLAGDLFSAPHMQFRHAFAAVLLAAIFSAILSIGAGRRRADPDS